jgi:hypothetical protein
MASKKEKGKIFFFFFFEKVDILINHKSKRKPKLVSSNTSRKYQRSPKLKLRLTDNRQTVSATTKATPIAALIRFSEVRV